VPAAAAFTEADAAAEIAESTASALANRQALAAAAALKVRPTLLPLRSASQSQPRHPLPVLVDD